MLESKTSQISLRVLVVDDELGSATAEGRAIRSTTTWEIGSARSRSRSACAGTGRPTRQKSIWKLNRCRARSQESRRSWEKTSFSIGGRWRTSVSFSTPVDWTTSNWAADANCGVHTCPRISMRWRSAAPRSYVPVNLSVPVAFLPQRRHAPTASNHWAKSHDIVSPFPPSQSGGGLT